MKVFKMVLIIIIIIFLFPKSFISSPGFVTEKYAEEFERTKKHCIGFSYLKNADEVAVDNAGESLCFGWLK